MKRIIIGWSTASGTGSTELCFDVAHYTEALHQARLHFRQVFAPAGYTLDYISIA